MKANAVKTSVKGHPLWSSVSLTTAALLSCLCLAGCKRGAETNVAPEVSTNDTTGAGANSPSPTASDTGRAELLDAELLQQDPIARQAVSLTLTSGARAIKNLKNRTDQALRDHANRLKDKPSQTDAARVVETAELLLQRAQFLGDAADIDRAIDILMTFEAAFEVALQKPGGTNPPFNCFKPRPGFSPKFTISKRPGKN